MAADPTTSQPSTGPAAGPLDGGPGLVLLVTSPRIAPGLLTRPAWRAVEAATEVLCADVDDPQPAALTETGVRVTATDAVATPAVARELVERAQQTSVVWVGSPDGDPGLTDALAVELSRVAVASDPPAVEVLVGSHDVAGGRLLDLVAVMDRLRSPGGCPWDAEQTHTGLVPHLVEEAFEAVEAIETGDRAAMREELGDVLLQVVFHARVAEEHADDPFDVDTVADGIVAKLVHRHPHVFAVTDGDDGAGDGDGDGSDDGATGGPDVTTESSEASWEALKAAEKGRASVLDGIPVALPALARAEKVLTRLQRAGLDVDDARPPDDAPGPAGAATSGRELGDQLLQLVRRARDAGVDPEAALRERVRDLEGAARAAEMQAP